MQLQEGHVRGLVKATSITGFMVKNAIPPLEVIGVLNRAGVHFMLVGAYALVGWTKLARATEDVDVIVTARQCKKALKALLTAFPHLQLDDQPAVARLRDRESGDLVIDVIKPWQELFRVALKNTDSVSSEGQTYKIPSLEMGLAMKFAAMISPSRNDFKKHIDAADFILMVRNNPDIDLKKLETLGDSVYLQGGKELLEKVGQVRAGITLQI